ncbi:hypothetical protein RFI_38706, partial [Reticulomyxa filosa]
LIDRLSDEQEDEDNRNYWRILNKMEYKQLNDAFNSLKYMLNKDDYWKYREALGTITLKLSGKQFDNAFNYLIYEEKNTYVDLLKMIVQRLDEKQMDIALNYFVDKLNDKNEHPNICIKCAELLGIIAVDLNGRHFDDAFQCLKNGLKDSDLNVQKSCVKSFSKKWNENQLNITSLLKGIAIKLNKTQIDSLFTCPINKFKDKSEWGCELYAISIGYVSTKLNKRQLGNVFECLNGLKDEHKCIRALYKKSLETISTKLNDKQLDRVFSAFSHGLKDLDKW